MDSKDKRIAELEKQLEEAKNNKVQLKVSTKGAIQINGIRRLPITLYKTEMETILAMNEKITKFIEDNKDDLATKD
tara:strand:- start:210 stop:437 length:228 start_codon:yes stop_codon:yes gene_type:complete